MQIKNTLFHENIARAKEICTLRRGVGILASVTLIVTLSPIATFAEETSSLPNAERLVQSIQSGNEAPGTEDTKTAFQATVGAEITTFAEHRAEALAALDTETAENALYEVQEEAQAEELAEQGAIQAFVDDTGAITEAIPTLIAGEDPTTAQPAQVPYEASVPLTSSKGLVIANNTHSITLYRPGQESTGIIYDNTIAFTNIGIGQDALITTLPGSLAEQILIRDTSGGTREGDTFVFSPEYRIQTELVVREVAGGIALVDAAGAVQFFIPRAKNTDISIREESPQVTSTPTPAESTITEEGAAETTPTPESTAEEQYTEIPAEPSAEESVEEVGLFSWIFPQAFAEEETVVHEEEVATTTSDADTLEATSTTEASEENSIPEATNSKSETITTPETIIPSTDVVPSSDTTESSSHIEKDAETAPLPETFTTQEVTSDAAILTTRTLILTVRITVTKDDALPLVRGFSLIPQNSLAAANFGITQIIPEEIAASQNTPAQETSDTALPIVNEFATHNEATIGALTTSSGEGVESVRITSERGTKELLSVTLPEHIKASYTFSVEGVLSEQDGVFTLANGEETLSTLSSPRIFDAKGNEHNFAKFERSGSLLSIVLDTEKTKALPFPITIGFTAQAVDQAPLTLQEDKVVLAERSSFPVTLTDDTTTTTLAAESSGIKITRTEKTATYASLIELGSLIEITEHAAYYTEGKAEFSGKVLKIRSSRMEERARTESGELTFSIPLVSSTEESEKEINLSGKSLGKKNIIYIPLSFSTTEVSDGVEKNKTINPLGMPLDAANFYAKQVGNYKGAWSYTGRDLSEGAAFFTGSKFITFKYADPTVKLNDGTYADENGDIFRYTLKEGAQLKEVITVAEPRESYTYQFELSPEYDYHVNDDKSVSALFYNESKINLTEDCSTDYRTKKEAERKTDKETLSAEAFAEKYGRLADMAIPMCNDTTAMEEAKSKLPKDTEITKIQAPFWIDAAGVRSENATFTLATTGEGVEKKVFLTLTATIGEDAKFPVDIDPTVGSVQMTQGLGSIGNWVAGTSMGTARQGLGSFAYNGYAYVTGGINGSSLSSTEYAAINSNGTLGTWTATTSMGTARHGQGAFAYNGYAYVIGGCTVGNCTSVSATTEYAQINSNGTLGTWTATSSMGTARYYHVGFAYNGYAYAIGGYTGINGTNIATTTEYAPINSNGTLGTWTATSSMTTARDGPGAFAYNGYAYVLGGQSLSSTEYAAINSNGTLGTWTATSSMTTARDGPGAFAYNGYAYAIGGHTGSGYLATTEYAPINGNGNLGTWTVTSSMGTVRHIPGAFTYNGYAYAVGGSVGGTSISTTEYAQINAVGLGGWTVTSSRTIGSQPMNAAFAYNGYAYGLGGATGSSATDYAPINANGTLGTWTATSSMVTARSYIGGGFAYNGYAYALGGAGLSSTEYAPINSNGTLGTWTATSSMTTARAYAFAFGYNGYAYIIGGRNGTPVNLSSTEYAPINSNGTLGTWVTTSNMTTARSHVSGFSYNGYVYALSGEGLSSTEYAPINSNGTIGTWVAGTTLNSNRGMASAFAYNGYAFIIGGSSLASTEYAPILSNGALGTWTYSSNLSAGTWHNGAFAYNGYAYVIGTATGATVEYAKIGGATSVSAGGVAGWQTTTSMNTGMQEFQPVAYNGYLYTIGGRSSGSGYNTSTVSYAPIAANGTIGAWSTTSSLITGRGGTNASFAYNGYMYTVGGYSSAWLSSAEYAAINSNGTLGSWTATASLSAGRGNAIGFAYNGYAYILGGVLTGDIYTATTVYATINSNGTLGTWTSGTSLNVARGGVGAFAYNGYAYAIGGYNGSTYHSSTEYAPINANGSLGTWLYSASLTGSRTEMTTFAYNGYAYAIGGYTGSAALALTEISTITASGALGGWSASGTSLNSTRYRSYGLAYQGYAYVLGGIVNGSTYSTSVEYWRIPQGQAGLGAWTATSSLGTAKRDFISFAYNGYAYAIGGQVALNTYSSSSEYAPINANGIMGSWASASSLNAARSYTAGFAYNGYAYAIGGYNGSNLSSTEYTPINSNGTLGTWTASSSLNTARYSHTAFAYNGYAYVIGGHNGSSGLTSTEYAPINSNGTLGTWTTSTSISGARWGVAAFAYNGYAYAIGGHNGSAVIAATEYAPINSNGTLGTWTASSSMNITRRSLGVFAYNGYVYAIGGIASSAYTYTNTIEYSPIERGGGLGSWVLSGNTLNSARGSAGSFAYNGYAYLIGGTNGDPNYSYLATTEFAPLASWTIGAQPATHDGAVGAWASTTSTGRSNLAGFAYNGYAYAIGGCNSCSPTYATVSYAPINSNGTIGSWTNTSSLNTQRANQPSAFAYNGYAYVIGGHSGDGGEYLGSVEYALINSNGTLGSWAYTSSIDTQTGVQAGYASASFGYNGYAYSFHWRTVAPYSAVTYAPINSNGTLGTWTETTNHGLGGTSPVLLYNGLFYVLALGSTKYAPIQPNGSIGTWVTTSATNGQPGDRMGFAYNGYAYAFTGSGFEYAPILSSGALGSWRVGAAPSVTGARQPAFAYNGYVYKIGVSSEYAKILTYDPKFVDAGNGSNTGDGLEKTRLGTLESWTAGTSINTGRVYGSGFTYNGYAYTLGGWNGSAALASVEYAAISGNGSLGSWSTTSSLNTARSSIGAFAYNGYAYVVGGCTTGTNCSSPLSSVERAVINANGTLGTWTATTSLGTARHSARIFAYNGYAYTIAGASSNSGAGLTSTEYAAISSDGTLGTWTATSSLNTARYGESAFAYNGYAYVIGGYNSGYLSSSEYAPINSNGTLGTWVATGSLQAARAFTYGFAYNGYAYVIGGFGGGAMSSTEYAAINSNGTLGTWAFTTSLGTARDGATIFAYNGYAYVIGGTGALSSTEYASINTLQLSATHTLSTTEAITSVAVSAPDSVDTGNTQVVTLGYKKDSGITNTAVEFKDGTQYFTQSFGTPSSTLTLYASSVPSYGKATLYAPIAVSARTTTSGGGGNTTPTVPTLVSPANASYTTDTTPTLSAQYIDADSGDTGTTNYRIATSSGNCTSGTSLTTSGTSSTSGSNNAATTWTPGSSIGADGTYYWCAQNDDGVAQSAWTAMGSFALDTTAPTITVSDNASGSFVTSDTIVATITDAGSGNATLKYDYDADGTCSSSAGDYANTYTSSATINVTSTHADYICFYAADNAGNIRTQATTQLKVDITSPTTSAAITAGTLGNNSYYTSTPTVTITPADAASGVASTVYCVDTANSCSPATNYSGSFKASSEGIGAWTASSTMNAARYNQHETIAYNGYLYALGGRTTGGTELASVEYAPINSNGSLGSWTATSSMLSTAAGLSAFVYNNYLYAIGGVGSGSSSSVQYAAIQGDGSLGSWTATSSLNTGRINARSIAYNGYAYTIGGYNGVYTALSSTEYAPIDASGALGAWSYTTSLQASRASFAAVTHNGYLYAVEGYTDAPVTSIEYTAIASDGTLGTWATTTSKPAWYSSRPSVVYGGYLYALSGDEYSYAPLNSDGTLGSWTRTLTHSMNTSGRNGFASAVYNGYVYAVGGDDCGQGCGTTPLASVEYAALSPAQGTRYVRYASTDTAGNTQSTQSLTVKIDTETPSAIATVTDNFTAAPTITLAATDATSGVASTLYCTDTTNTCTPVTSYASAITLATNGVHYVRFTATDAAGMQSTQSSGAIYVDQQAPQQATISINSVTSTPKTLDLDFARMTTLDSRITFDRNSIATYYDENGVLQTAAADEARFDHDPVTHAAKGLLVEESRTNMVLQSSAVSHASWTKSNANAVSATTLEDASAGATGFAYQDIAIPNDTTTYTASWYVSKNSGIVALQVNMYGGTSVNRAIAFDTSTGNYTIASSMSALTTYADVVDAGDAGWRVSFAIANNASGNTIARFYAYPAYASALSTQSNAAAFTAAAPEQTGSTEMYHMQLEAGPFATSYIPTTTTAVTRATDDVSMTDIANNMGFNQTAGTFIADFSSAHYRTNVHNYVFQIDDGTADNRHVILLGLDEQIYAYSIGNEEYYAQFAGWTPNTTIRVAHAYAAGNMASVKDGGTVTTATTATIPSGITTLHIGSAQNTAHLNGHISRIAYYPARLSNTELQNTTNQSTVYTGTNLATLQLHAADDTAMNQMQFSCNATDWTTAESYANTTSFDLTDTDSGCNGSDGEKTVYARFGDAAGNWTTASIGASDTVHYETAAPTSAAITFANDTWVSRTNPVDNNWRSVAYGNGTFVAVAITGAGDRVMTSADGITWTARTSAADNNWTSVTYGNGLFVAVSNTGTGNRVMTSPDGITWTARTSAADNQWQGVTYGNGLFVAVAISGTGNRVMTSPDGITWTLRTSAADNQWRSVTYGNGLFVAVANSGTGNRVMTSPDGITWTLRTSAADNNWLSVTYGNGLFVAVANSGTGNRVMTSTDGITWTTRTSTADNGWVGITYGNGLFVAVAITGTGNRIMTLSDAIAPTSISMQELDATDALSGLAASWADFRIDSTTSSGFVSGSTGATFSSLSPNTAYTFEVRTVDAVGNTSAYSTPVTKYTAANVPSAPSVSLYSTSALDVTINPNSNPAGTTYAIAFSADNWSTTQYVQTDLTLNTGAVYRTCTAWGAGAGCATALRVTGLTSSTSYKIRLTAQNGDGLTTAASAETSVTTTESLTANINSSTAALGAATPLIAATGTTTLSIASNSGSGYTISLKRDDADATLTHIDAATTIADKTAWNPSATSGSGNAETFTGTGLGVRVQETGTLASLFSSLWWGTDATPKYAGTTTSYTTIAETSAYQSGTNDIVVEYQLVTPTTQKTGAYSGTVTLRVQSDI